MAAQQDAPAPSRASGHRTTIAEYPDYGDAERAVEYLTDHDFPVERVAIVGADVRLVEQIVGRVNYPGAALRGAGSGAFTGVLIGWLFGLFNWVAPVVASLALAAYGLVIGAVLGAVFGLVAHALQRGRRDFASVRAMAPSRYQVVADADVADRARGLLAQLDGGR
ncbi:general stress protein [Kutzneria chonburiensis]|uniref:General stress protein n=1 Tax=Kutzneria chonburiensis TaxID=1483604 RepID=A0ABV6MQK6_9PSEU|nr:general stress protein [Kutzneria chonburiensis]